MAILCDILTAPVSLPVKGVFWIFQTLIEYAERELYDETKIRRDLAMLEAEHEQGIYDEDVFEQLEANLLELLAVARKMKGT